MDIPAHVMVTFRPMKVLAIAALGLAVLLRIKAHMVRLLAQRVLMARPQRKRAMAVSLLATRSPLLAIRHHRRHMARVLKQIAQPERQCSQMEPVCKGRPAIQRRQAHIAQVAHMRGLLQDLLIQDLL